MMIAEALELPAVGLAGAPEVTERRLPIVGPDEPVHDVIPGLVLQAAVMEERPRA